MEHELPLLRAAKSGTAVGVAQIGAYLLGFFLSVAIAAKFGAAHLTDAYFMASSTAELLSKLFLGGALTAVLLPLFVQRVTDGDPARAWRLFSTLFTLALIGFALIGGLLELLADPLIRFLAPGFADATQTLSVNLLRVVLPAYVFTFLSELATVPLHAHRRFGIPATTRLIVPALMLLLLLAFAGVIGIYTLALGTLIGTGLQLAALLASLRRSGYRFRFTLGLANPDLRHTIALALPFVFATLATYGAGVVYRILVSQGAEGSFASLKFGEKIFQMANFLFIGTIAQVSFPIFATAVSSRSWDIVRDRLRTAIRLVTFVGIPLTVGLILLREPLVRAVFQRGAFTAEATAMTATFVPLYVIGLVGNGISSLLGHLTLALQKTRVAVAVSVALQAILASLFVLLVPRIGVAGIALASGLGPFVLTGLYLIALRREVPKLGRMLADPLFPKLALAGAACATLVGLTTARAEALLSPSLLRDISTLVAGGTAGLAGFLGVAWLLKVREVTMVRDLATHAFRSLLRR